MAQFSTLFTELTRSQTERYTQIPVNCARVALKPNNWKMGLKVFIFKFNFTVSERINKACFRGQVLKHESQGTSISTMCFPSNVHELLKALLCPAGQTWPRHGLQKA